MPLGRLFVLILLAQIALVCLLGDWSGLNARVPTPRSLPRLVWLAGGVEGAPVLPGGAVLAEVSSAGFSGALWRGGDSMRWSAPLAPGFVERTGAEAAPGPAFSDSAPVRLSPQK